MTQESRSILENLISRKLKCLKGFKQKKILEFKSVRLEFKRTQMIYEYDIKGMR